MCVCFFFLENLILWVIYILGIKPMDNRIDLITIFDEKLLKAFDLVNYFQKKIDFSCFNNSLKN